MCNVPVLSIAYDTKVIEFAKLMRRLNSEVLGMGSQAFEGDMELILPFQRVYWCIASILA